jgi:molybdate transport system substrate-binding protein
MVKILLCILGLGWCLQVCAADFKLYAAAGVKLPLQQIAQGFAQNGPDLVLLDFDTAGAAQDKFQKDPEATFLITTEERLRAAQAGGQLGPGQMYLLADTVAGIAFSGKPKPTISTEEDLRRALLSARSIAFSDPARGATVGKHFAAMIRSLGIEEAVLAKATLARDGVHTMQLVQTGAVELGITQLSEVVQADASTLVGPFPGRWDLYTRYALWVRQGDQAGVARFVQDLRSEAGLQSFRSQGLRPVTAP